MTNGGPRTPLTGCRCSSLGQCDRFQGCRSYGATYFEPWGDFLVHGIRHIANRPTTVAGDVITLTRDEVERHLDEVAPGDELRLHDEPTKTVNPLAILTTTSGEVPLGWAPDLRVEELHRIPNHDQAGVTAIAVNGPDAGWHLRLLAHLSMPVPEGFEVFTDDRWQPAQVRF